MPRKQKNYHFIYKTTNLKNGKFYIGMHSTSNLNDGYLGSGNKLRRAIRKYGVDNFKFEILQFFNSRELLAEKEKELVNEETLKDPMCMNLRKGGEGGWHKWANLALKEKLKDPEYKSDFAKKIKIGRYKSCYNIDGNWIGVTWKDTYDWRGKKHKPETIEKMKESKKGFAIGEKNSQYGSFWITNGKENKKTKSEIPEGWYRGRVV
jgi:hypothetical protein